MKKYYSIISSAIFILAFLVGCGPTKEEKKEEIRKKSMGTGNIPIDGKRETGGI